MHGVPETEGALSAPSAAGLLLVQDLNQKVAPVVIMSFYQIKAVITLSFQ